jgi:Leucine-rich repeat (LRR) protein
MKKPNHTNTPNTLLDSESLEKEPVFYSLEEALQTPLKVYKLDLSSNQLKTLPKEMAELKNLKTLDLSNNQFNTLPKEIAELKNLQELYLGKNPISDEEKKNIKKILPKCNVWLQEIF